MDSKLKGDAFCGSFKLPPDSIHAASTVMAVPRGTFFETMLAEIEKSFVNGEPCEE
jgi:hypothetical protein